MRRLVLVNGHANALGRGGRIRRAGVIAAGLAALAATAVAPASVVFGPEWDEVGDAGSLPGSAQTVLGTGPVGQIRGSLATTAFGGDQQDMYLINITGPTAVLGGPFVATTDSSLGGSTSFDSALWLFDANGLGLLGTTSATFSGGAATLGNFATDGTGLVITTPGLYYLAISVADSVPLSGSSLPIFLFTTPGEVSGPDGSGASTPIAGWTTGSGGGGDYIIKLTGVSFIPGPAGWAVLCGVGAACGAARRRRNH